MGCTILLHLEAVRAPGSEREFLSVVMGLCLTGTYRAVHDEAGLESTRLGSRAESATSAVKLTAFGDIGKSRPSMSVFSLFSEASRKQTAQCCSRTVSMVFRVTGLAINVLMESVPFILWLFLYELLFMTVGR
jgi:hypothetical protein